MNNEDVLRFFDQYADDAFRLAYSYLGSRPEAEDVVQDVFLKLIRSDISITKGKEKTYVSSYSLRPVINHKVKSNHYTVYRLPEYTQEMARLVSKKIDVHKLRQYCKKLMGAFAYC